MAVNQVSPSFPLNPHLYCRFDGSRLVDQVIELIPIDQCVVELLISNPHFSRHNTNVAKDLSVALTIGVRHK
jgi:hypothetical protein